MNKSEIKHIVKYLLKYKYRKQIDNILKSIKYHDEGCRDCITAPKVLIIQRLNEMVGTFSDYIVFLHYIERAIAQGKIPIIDRRTNKNFFLSASEEDNTWEFFFEQPNGLKLEQIDYRTMSVQRCYTSDLCSVSLLRCKDEDIIANWRKIAKKYIRLNNQTESHINKWYKNILEGKRVLGISIREGYEVCFTKTTVGKGHALQANIQNIISDAKEYCKKWNCDYVFLTCQRDETIEVFREIFNERLLTYTRKRTIVDDKAAHSQRTPQEEYQNELDYITEMVLLSKCTSFLCSENSGSEAAFIMSEGFENMYCYRLGIS